LSQQSSNPGQIEDNFDDTDEYDVVWWLMIRTRRLMRKARARDLLLDGVTPAEAGVLLAAKAIGYEATPTKISRWLLREPHTTSAILDRMEKKELLRKVKDLDRKNMVRVELTAKGKQAYKHAARRDAVHKILSVLSDEELRQMRLYLEKIQAKALEEVGGRRETFF